MGTETPEQKAAAAAELAKLAEEGAKKAADIEAASDKEAKSKQLTAGQKSTLKQLQARPKKTILIPEDPLNPDDMVVPVGINGVIYSIPRGKAFEVPDLIFDVWHDSYQKTLAANRRIVMKEDRSLAIR